MSLGLVIGFASVLLIFSDYTKEMQNRNFLLGIGLSLISVISWSFGSVYSSRHKSSVNILFNVGLQMLIAGIIMLLACGITGKYVSLASVSSDSWMALLYLVLIGSLLAYSAYVFAISKLPPTQVSIYAYINPVVAVLLGWLLLSEKMNMIMAAGIAITLGGVYIVNREFKKAKQ